MFVRARYFAVFPMLCFISYANVAEGLIVSGLDTIHYPHEFGFDFVRMESCTSYSMPREGGCWNHFHFVFTQPGLPSARFDLSLQAFGYGIRMGKLNLDSIKSAPSDSVFMVNHRIHVDSLYPDSLSTYIGNSYVFRTGTDSRCHCVYRAKIRILDFIIHDLANHEVDMVFLWACNVDNWWDLATTNLDTLEVPTSISQQSRPAAISSSPRPAIRQQGYVALRNGTAGVGVVAVKDGVGWDLKGKTVK